MISVESSIYFRDWSSSREESSGNIYLAPSDKSPTIDRLRSTYFDRLITNLTHERVLECPISRE